MIPVITISREFGSEKENIAEEIAKTLGYHFVDKSSISDLLGQYGVVEFDREYETLPSFWERFNSVEERRRDQSVDMFNQAVRAIARHGNVVILGRSGFEVLIDYADVLRVRLQAPFSVRVERIMMQEKITHEQAEEMVKKSDKVRMAYVDEFYKVPWKAIRAFDLVINTSKISPQLATNWVVKAAKAFTYSMETDKPITRSIEVDPILAGAVSDVLGCKMLHE